jgi:hypothetical protein
MDADVMKRTLEKYKNTNFIWAHVDHGFYWNIGLILMKQFSNLYCDFGVSFRADTREDEACEWLTGTAEQWQIDHIARWRQICKEFPERVMWGMDLYTWHHMHRDCFPKFIESWKAFSKEFTTDLKLKITEKNILRLTGVNLKQDPSTQR